MEFGSGGYSTPMDRNYDVTAAAHHDCGHDHGTKATGDVGVSIGELGFSFSLGPVPNVQAIASKLHPGSRKLEMTFLGRQKGSGQQHTPEYYGEKQRQALREIATVNRVDFTTHSTVGVAGLAGMDGRGNFTRESKTDSLLEVKRAIEFAADVGRGGPVVVHTGEFSRSIQDAAWNRGPNDPWAGKFQWYEDEAKRAGYRIVDTRTGGVLHEAHRNLAVPRPVWLRAEQDDNSRGVRKGDYIDYFGKKVGPEERVPVYNKEQGRFEIQQLQWDDLEKEAQDMTARARRDYERFAPMVQNPKDLKILDNNEEFRKSIWRERIREAITKGLKKDAIEIRPEEAYVISALETQAAHARGWASQYGDFQEIIDTMTKLDIALKKAEIAEEEAKGSPERLAEMRIKTRDLIPGVVTDESKLPSEVIKDQLRSMKHRMEQSREAASSQWSQSEEALERIRHAKSAEVYALDEAADAYADLGIAAMRQGEKLAEKGQLKKNLTVAMENLFPEQYGSHPDELKNLVLRSRDTMTQKLKLNLGLSEDEARKRAREHITATLDVGHMNMWRKYWKGSAQKTIGENDKEFEKWMVEKVKDLVKSDVIGHIHLDDNYGYHDDHLAPGEGNTPIRELVKTLKENGYKGEMIVEPGADFSTDTSGFKAVTKAWQHFGISTYQSASGSFGPKGRPWKNVEYGWFGQNQPPYFTFGGYVPSEDFSLWSGVPFE